MSYRALYRVFRPQTFSEVRGQDHISTTLKNAILTERLAHAYLFCGPRGTGKTSSAKILAKAVNCLDLQNGEPCNQCANCRAINEDNFLDVLEIDAASNRGIDEIRDLRDKVRFAPSQGKKKVYIIDEVHMLTNEAFNALLKIMEEPPPYVKFILATTDLHKVPPTVLSRCQRFDFRRIAPSDIVDRIKTVAEKEGTFTVNDEAARLIARLSDGGMRDALSLLDQCIAFSSEITPETVSSAAGIAGRDYLFDIIDAVSENDISRVISVTDRLYGMSKDMQRLCEELISQFRNMMLIKTIPGQNEILACMPDEIDRLTEIAGKMTLPDILEKLDILQTCCDRLSRSLNKRTELEMCFVRLCMKLRTENTAAVSAAPSADITAIQNRLAALEQGMSSQTPPQPQPNVRNVPIINPERNQPASTPSSADTQKIDMSKFVPVSCWAEILERYKQLCPPAAGFLNGTMAVEHENQMLILTNSDTFAKLFTLKDNQDKLKQAVAEVTGKQYAIKCYKAKPKNAESSPAAEIIAKAQRSGIPTELQ